MHSSLVSFSMIEQTNKFFIIGDMLELGEEEKAEHAQIAKFAKKLELHGFTVGPIFKKIKSAAFEKQFENKAEAIAYLIENPIKNNLILLKGSRGIGLETLEDSL
jgi:UDP-N-acetylmuramoyl-tripeptide--D-alanyl-D-alanine ligase